MVLQQQQQQFIQLVLPLAQALVGKSLQQTSSGRPSEVEQAQPPGPTVNVTAWCNDVPFATAPPVASTADSLTSASGPASSIDPRESVSQTGIRPGRTRVNPRPSWVYRCIEEANGRPNSALAGNAARCLVAGCQRVWAILPRNVHSYTRHLKQSHAGTYDQLSQAGASSSGLSQASTLEDQDRPVSCSGDDINSTRATKR